MNDVPSVSSSALKDRWVQLGAASTVLALLGCIATHLVTGFGLAGAIFWLAEAEHALLGATLAGLAFTLFAFWRHRRGQCGHAGT